MPYFGSPWYLEEYIARIPQWVWRVAWFGFGFVVGLKWR